jgi:hypothetical protein
VRTAIGTLVFVAHVLALPVLLDRCRRADLEVRVHGAPAAAAFDLRGELPAALAGAVAVELSGDPDEPGLHRVRWSLAHRGGFVRSVGAAQLVGPFQDPATPACGGRLVVGQAFLDRIAPLVRDNLARELAGFDEFPVGAFRRVAAAEVRWARFDDATAAAGDAALFGELAARTGPTLARLWNTDGYARIRIVVELSRVSAEVTVALVPRVALGRLTFELFAHADVRYGNSVVDWALDTFRADAYATRVVREEIDDAILRAFDPPPPFELPGGRSLRVDYCPGAHLEVASGQWAALPLGLRFEGPAGPHRVLPPRQGPAVPPPPDAGTSIAFDLDLDTLNALLYELWRTGFLDEQLDAAGLDRRFNEDPTVTALLSLRISPLRLALPPVISATPSGLTLAADLRVNLGDGGAVTPARVWAAVALDLAAGATSAGLAELELSCEPEPGLLRPCYGDLVAAMRARAGDARAELSAVLVRVLDDVFTGQRVSAPDTPAELVLGAPTTTAHGGNVRVAIDARLDPRP